MKDFLMRLTSRKFLLVVFVMVILLAGAVPVEYKWPLILLVASYLTSEGVGDAAARVAQQKTEQVKLVQATQVAQADANRTIYAADDEDVDTTTVIPGGGTAPL
jgi:hypothetical protein